MKRSREPFIWAFFSAGGMLTAFVLPAIAIGLWIVPALGWADAISAEQFLAKVGHPIMRLFLFALVSLSLFHWGHRFRYTLYDGLQLSHLYGLIAAICYGGATAGTLLAAWILFS